MPSQHDRRTVICGPEYHPGRTQTHGWTDTQTALLTLTRWEGKVRELLAEQNGFPAFILK